MEIEKEKNKNDKIIKICMELIEKIKELKEEEEETNEGAITEKEYVGLISNINNIIKERIIYLNFWEEE